MWEGLAATCGRSWVFPGTLPKHQVSECKDRIEHITGKCFLMYNQTVTLVGVMFHEPDMLKNDFLKLIPFVPVNCMYQI